MGIGALLLASALFTSPAPLDMPRASAYFCRDNGRMYLEDRYDVDDLWLSRAVTGCWIDDEFRAFTLAELEYLPPAVGGKMPRTEFETSLAKPERRNEEHLRRMIAAVSPVEIGEGDPVKAKRVPHGMKDVRYWEGTNEAAIVCAYHPEDSDHWRLAVWELAEGDDREEMRRVFEEEFFHGLDRAGEKLLAAAGMAKPKKAEGKSAGRRKAAPGERELLKRDVLRSVAAYDEWHYTPSEEFVIVDDLKTGRDFVERLTNSLPVLRRRFAEVMPTKLDTTNVLSVARIYRDRADFLLAAGEEMQWSAAFWRPDRREIVACLPPDGSLAELAKTFRHESFHQYLSYATSMIPVSPWLNEGYAQYFEDELADDLGFRPTEEKWDELELGLPALFTMDYKAFYAGTDDERRMKYRLARSIAVFMEKGLSEIAHEPFRTFKRDYFDALFETRDMRKATERAFDSPDRLKLFCNEWKKFWKLRQE